MLPGRASCPGFHLKHIIGSHDRSDAVKKPRIVKPPAAGSALPLVPRVFAVLAAALLVGSVALASLLPPEMSLREALAALDETWPEGLQRAVLASLGIGIWESVVVPVLVRPVWLLPVALGLICVGGAVTTHSPAAPHTKQRPQ
jgi:hypothetical protein